MTKKLYFIVVALMSILALAACSVTEENNVSTRDEGYNEDILEEIPSEYSSEQNDTTDIIQDSIEDANKVDNSINFEEERMVSDDPQKVDSTSMDKTWEEVYKAILCDIDSNATTIKYNFFVMILLLAHLKIWYFFKNLSQYFGPLCLYLYSRKKTVKGHYFFVEP